MTTIIKVRFCCSRTVFTLMSRPYLLNAFNPVSMGSRRGYPPKEAFRTTRGSGEFGSVGTADELMRTFRTVLGFIVLRGLHLACTFSNARPHPFTHLCTHVLNTNGLGLRLPRVRLATPGTHVANIVTIIRVLQLALPWFRLPLKDLNLLCPWIVLRRMHQRMLRGAFRRRVGFAFASGGYHRGKHWTKSKVISKEQAKFFLLEHENLSQVKKIDRQVCRETVQGQ